MVKYLNPYYLATQGLTIYLGFVSALGYGARAFRITGPQDTHLGSQLPPDLSSVLQHVDNNNQISHEEDNGQHRVKRDNDQESGYSGSTDTRSIEMHSVGASQVVPTGETIMLDVEESFSTDLSFTLTYRNEIRLRHHRVIEGCESIRIGDCLTDLALDGKWKEVMRFISDLEQDDIDLKQAGHDINISSLYNEIISKIVTFAAVEQNRFDALQFLMDKNIDPNVSGMAHSVPLLSYAAEKGNVEMVKLLLEYGADINAKDEGGKNALWYAKKSSNKNEIIALLKSHKIISDGKNNHRLLKGCMEKISPCIVDLARDGKWEEVMELINDFEQKGYDVSSAGNGGIHIIYTAVEQNKFDEVQFLLNKKVDPNVIWAHLPLLLVAIRCEKSNVEMVELLLKYDADPNVRGAAFMGNVPLLSYAVEKGNMGMIKLLLEYSADPNTKDNRGRDVFWYAGKSSNKDEIIALLESQGALQKTDDSQSVLTNAFIDSDIDTSMATTYVSQTNLTDVVTVPGTNVSRSLDI